MTLKPPQWLGVDAVDGATSGPLELCISTGTGLFKVYLSGADHMSCVVSRCPLSEVDAATRAWIRSVAECDPDIKAELNASVCMACNERSVKPWEELLEFGWSSGTCATGDIALLCGDCSGDRR